LSYIKQPPRGHGIRANGIDPIGCHERKVVVDNLLIVILTTRLIRVKRSVCHTAEIQLLVIGEDELPMNTRTSPLPSNCRGREPCRAHYCCELLCPGRRFQGPPFYPQIPWRRRIRSAWGSLSLFDTRVNIEYSSQSRTARGRAASGVKRRS